VVHAAGDQWLRGPAPSDLKVIVVDIDRASIDALGTWPWPQETMARLVEAVATGRHPDATPAWQLQRYRGAQAAVRASLGHRSPHHDAALAQDGGNARRAAVELAVEGGLRPAALAQHLADRNATGGSQGPGGKTTP
jgi:CHASE2 domain